MNRIKETIRDYEYITAGRFYSRAQKQTLFDLVSRANMLLEQERTDLAAVVFSSEVEQYYNEVDCANGLLLMSVIRDDSHIKDILTCRKKTLENLTGKRMWDSKDNWLRFIHTQNNNFYAQFENAIYAYSVDDINKSVTMLKPLADSCHRLSVKLQVALYGELPDKQEEAKYLILFKRITEDLYYEIFPAEFELRLKELLNKLPAKVVEEAHSIKLNYFSEFSNSMARIGFN